MAELNSKPIITARIVCRCPKCHIETIPGIDCVGCGEKLDWSGWDINNIPYTKDFEKFINKFMEERKKWKK